MFPIYWGQVSADSDGPVEWCKPVSAAEAEGLAAQFPELTLRVEPASPGTEGPCVLAATTGCSGCINFLLRAPSSPRGARPLPPGTGAPRSANELHFGAPGPAGVLHPLGRRSGTRPR